MPIIDRLIREGGDISDCARAAKDYIDKDPQHLINKILKINDSSVYSKSLISILSYIDSNKYNQNELLLKMLNTDNCTVHSYAINNLMKMDIYSNKKEILDGLANIIKNTYPLYPVIDCRRRAIKLISKIALPEDTEIIDLLVKVKKEGLHYNKEDEQLAPGDTRIDAKIALENIRKK